jgi:hypothetical protein
MILGMVGRWPHHIYDFIIGTLFGRDSRSLPRRLTPEVKIMSVVVNARTAQDLLYATARGHPRRYPSEGASGRLLLRAHSF